jgi:hypothetical protein
MTRFGGDRGIIGSSVRLDGELYTVIGVMPSANLHFYDTPIWRPLPASVPAQRSWRDLQMAEARLKPASP